MPSLSTQQRIPARVSGMLAATTLCLAALTVPSAAQPRPTDGGDRGTADKVARSCAGTSPIICTYDVPSGNYDVTVRLGSRHRAASTEVYAEARRHMVDLLDTGRGKYATRSFAVNVRTPEGQQNDFGVPGTPGLTLTFAGAAPAVADVRVRPAARSTQRLFLIGDSTVTDQETPPYTGWGQRLPAFFGRGVVVVNHSGSGESTVSYLADPRLWATVRPQIRRGDTVLIQLAHNDKTTTAETYRENLATMIDGIRDRGGLPVLVTPIVRHRFEAGQLNATGLIVNSIGVDLPAQVRVVATEKRVGVIDLTARSEALVESLGEQDAEPIYLIRDNGDRTHTSEYGATVYAAIVAADLGRFTAAH